jgi:hypothetical protein
MIDPVPSGILGKRKVTYGASVDFFVELEEDAEASLCEDHMCGFGKNVVV